MHLSTIRPTALMVGGFILLAIVLARRAPDLAPARQATATATVTHFLARAQDGVDILDRAANGCELIAGVRADARNSSGRSLWIRAANGQTRLLASNIVSALFAPDGRRLLHLNQDGDMVIETLSGEAITKLSRVREAVWRSNEAVSFIGSADPDQVGPAQWMSYDTCTGRITPDR